MIDADRDQIISTSWGLCEQAIQAGQPGLQQAENLLFEQAAAQGQSVFGAAGDNGSDDCNTFETPTVASGQNPVSVDDPAASRTSSRSAGTTIDERHASRRSSRSGTTAWPTAAPAAAASPSRGRCRPGSAAADVPGIDLPGSADYANANAVEKEFGYPRTSASRPARRERVDAVPARARRLRPGG